VQSSKICGDACRGVDWEQRRQVQLARRSFDWIGQSQTGCSGLRIQMKPRPRTHPTKATSLSLQLANLAIAASNSMIAKQSMDACMQMQCMPADRRDDDPTPTRYPPPLFAPNHSPEHPIKKIKADPSIIAAPPSLPKRRRAGGPVAMPPTGSTDAPESERVCAVRRRVRRDRQPRARASVTRELASIS
jgi:hypothetical protein